MLKTLAGRSPEKNIYLSITDPGIFADVFSVGVGDTAA
jgi:hypothetical protein